MDSGDSKENNCITIVQSSRDGVSDAIVIDDLYKQIQRDDYERYYKYFISNSFESETFLPLFDILWPHLIYSPKGGLIESLLLFDELDKEMDDKSPESVVIKKLDRRSYVVLKDVLNKHDVTIENDRSPPPRRSNLGILGRDVIPAMIFVLKQGLRKLPPINSSSFPKSSVQVFPFPNRFDSLSPVINNSECDMDIISEPSKVSTPNKDEVSDRSFDESGIYEFMNLSNYFDILRQIIFIFQLLPRLFLKSTLVSNISSRIREKEGFDVSNIVSESYIQAIKSNPRNICTGIVTGRLFRDKNTKKVVVGGLAPRDRSIIVQADRHNMDLYYVPHTVEIALEQLPPKGASMFVSGPVAKKHIQNTYSASILPELIPMGRPYLQEKYKNNNKNITQVSSDDDLSILALTQMNSDSIRSEFIDEIIRGAKILDSYSEFDSTQVIIKLHPSESKDFYNNLLNTIEYSGIKVTIVEDSLYHYLYKSDFTITINSNAGLESMMLGTPCISINFNEPVTMTYPYVEYGNIPVLRCSSDVNTFFKDISSNTINAMAVEQFNFARENYILEEDGGSNISSYICSE